MNPKIQPALDSIQRAIFGKDHEIRLALTCLLAGGHLLIEDLPGIGKTTLSKVMAITLGLEFCRIQCTNDMLPGDILGVSVFEQNSGNFRFHPGPVFTQILLADEINRATPKTQSALLEAMEERQVTLDGETRALPSPFFVIATQNPLEQAGTYPLPESQLDRFLMRIRIGYPDRESEARLLKGESEDAAARTRPHLSAEEILDIREAIRALHVSDATLRYLQDLIAFTRTAPHFQFGLSPRAGIAILQAARAWALVHDRDFCLPEDIQAVYPFVVSHRLRRSRDLTGFSPEDIQETLTEVVIP